MTGNQKELLSDFHDSLVEKLRPLFGEKEEDLRKIEEIAKKATEALCLSMGGGLISIPSITRLSDSIRNKKIKELRAAGMTIPALAERFGLHYQEINRILKTYIVF